MTWLKKQNLCCAAALLGVSLGLLGFSDKGVRAAAERDQNKAVGKDPATSARHRIPFDTGILKGAFHFADPVGQQEQTFGKADRPGVVDCVYKPLGVRLVNVTPANALFMPEWIMSPKGKSGTLWKRAFFIEPEPIPNGVRVRYPDKDLAADGLRCTLEYRAVGDMLFLDGYFEATRSHKALELLFASYITNKLDATYVPHEVNSKLTWQYIRRVTPHKSVFLIPSSPDTRRWVLDARRADTPEVGDWSLVYFPEWSFAAPILVDLEESGGLAVVVFVDDSCILLVGQYHEQDTAHDFSWGWHSLEPGQKVHTRAALWITQLQGTHDRRMSQVLKKYQEWRSSWSK